MTGFKEIFYQVYNDSEYNKSKLSRPKYNKVIDNIINMFSADDYKLLSQICFLFENAKSDIVELSVNKKTLEKYINSIFREKPKTLSFFISSVINNKFDIIFYGGIGQEGSNYFFKLVNNYSNIKLIDLYADNLLQLYNDINIEIDNLGE